MAALISYADHAFKDEKLFYRFLSDSPSTGFAKGVCNCDCRDHADTNAETYNFVPPLPTRTHAHT